MQTIALFGEILADIFPDYTVLGGAPYNVARHLRAFQQHPLLISKTGDDALKAALFAELSQLGMDHTGIQVDSAYPTGQVVIQMDNKQHCFEIKPNQAYDHIDDAITHRTIIAAQPDLVYFGTLAQRHADSKQALGAFLDASDSPRFLDINLRAPWYDTNTIKYALSQADIVKMNDEELHTICQLLTIEATQAQALALHLMHTFQLTTLFVTCGKDGAWVCTNDGQITHTDCPPLAKPLVDTVGAGDAFSAICILGILHRWPTTLTLARANTFATAICTMQGAAPDTIDFYLPYIQDWAPITA